MPEGRGIDAPAAVAHGPFDGPVERRMRFVREGQHVDILRRTADVVVHLDVRGEPRPRQASVDGMFAATLDQCVEAFAVTRVLTFAGWDPLDAPVVRYDERMAEVLLAPADADHVVVGRPIGKRVVAGMPDVHAAAA